MSAATATPDQWAHFLRTMDKAVAELAEGYVALSGMLTPGAGAPGESGSSSSGIPAPLRLDVIDVMAMVERTVAELVPLVRGALRLGLDTGPRDERIVRTVRGIRFLGRVLQPVYDDDPVLGARVTDELWDARRRVSIVAGEGVRPFRLAAPCQSCGASEVWVRPDRWQTRCRACGVVEAADGASVVFSVSSQT